MLKVVELFSGIGSQAKALKNIGVNFEVVNTSEWNITAIIAYDIIHNGEQDLSQYSGLTKKDMIEILGNYTLSTNGKVQATDRALKSLDLDVLKKIAYALKRTKNFGSIVDITSKNLEEDIDILTYSFPCQDLSNVGAFHGYKDGIDRGANTRSGMLWEVERILLQMEEDNKVLPKFLLLENVPNILSSRHIKNFNEWKNNLNQLGYYNHVYILNSKDFGIPQNRKRAFMISVNIGGNKDFQKKLDEFFKLYDLGNIDYVNSKLFKKRMLHDCLKINYSNKKYYTEAIESQSYNTPSRKVIFRNNPLLVNEQQNIIEDSTRTITTKQDRNPNSGNICFESEKNNYRFLTPRECFLLMGFDENDYDVLLNNNIKSRGDAKIFTRDKLYKMAGNSIVVNVLEHIFEQIIQINSTVLNSFDDLEEN